MRSVYKLLVLVIIYNHRLKSLCQNQMDVRFLHPYFPKLLSNPFTQDNPDHVGAGVPLDHLPLDTIFLAF